MYQEKNQQLGCKTPTLCALHVCYDSGPAFNLSTYFIQQQSDDFWSQLILPKCEFLSRSLSMLLRCPIPRESINNRLFEIRLIDDSDESFICSDLVDNNNDSNNDSNNDNNNNDNNNDNNNSNNDNNNNNNDNYDVADEACLEDKCGKYSDLSQYFVCVRRE